MLKTLILTTALSCLGAYASESDQPVITLKPGETATVVKRTVVTIKTTTETASPIPTSSSWRCKNIPDEAFSHLGTYSKGSSARHSWENRAGEFIATYAPNCPSFAALERDLPPALNQKKYTQMLSVMYDLGKMLRPEGLLRIAREDELAKVRNRPPGKNDEYSRLLLRASAAKILLEVKFPDEIKGRNEAHRFVQTFGTDFLDRSGNAKTENFASLKDRLKQLPPQQKISIRGYLKDTLAQREYPKSGLVPPKQERVPTSMTKKESGNRSVIQLLLFELE